MKWTEKKPIFYFFLDQYDIHVSSWKFYGRLDENNQHMAVNYSDNFVHPDSGNTLKFKLNLLINDNGNETGFRF